MRSESGSHLMLVRHRKIEEIDTGEGKKKSPKKNMRPASICGWGVQGNHVYSSQRVIAGTHTTRYWRASLFLGLGTVLFLGLTAFLYDCWSYCGTTCQKIPGLDADLN